MNDLGSTLDHPADTNAHAQGGPDESTQHLTRSLEIVVCRLAVLMETDVELRSAVMELAERLLKHATSLSANDVATFTSPPSDYEERFFRAPTPPVPVSPPLAAESHASEIKAPIQHTLTVSDSDLPQIERRCRLKAQACRWAAQRSRYIEAGRDFRSEVAPQDQQLVAQANELPDCFLWMCSADAPCPTDLSQWDAVADAFFTVTDALVLARSLMQSGQQRDQAMFEQSLDLLAEAQSALRVTVLSLTDRDDWDQAKVHRWLRQVTTEQGIYIKRYMRLDDPADPENLPDLQQRLERLQQQWNQNEEQQRKRQRGFQRIRYHLQQLQGGSLNSGHDWGVIAKTVDDLVSSGVRPSDSSLRELLLPHMDDLVDVSPMPPGFDRVVKEIDRYLQSRPEEESSRHEKPPSPDVETVRKFLAGHMVVVIGGKRRIESQKNLERAFGLKELIWDDTQPHQPLSDFEPAIARPEVSLVLLAIRWSSHSFGGVKEICTRHGKPLVRLPGGYGVNRVAAEILAQCSGHFTAATDGGWAHQSGAS
jgi:hypothetical protein